MNRLGGSGGRCKGTVSESVFECVCPKVFKPVYGLEKDYFVQVL